MSVGVAINAHGEVTGSLWTSISTSPSVHAFLHSGGLLLALEEAPNSESAGYGINNAGQVVGSVSGRAFVYSNGSTKVLDGLDGEASRAFGINAAGHITGSISRIDAEGYCYGTGFVYSNSIVTEIENVAALAINDADMVIGAMDVVLDTNATPTGHNWNHAPHAFLKANGVLKDLGTFGGCCSIGYAINTAGEIVGWAHDSMGKVRAFFYKDGVLQMLDQSAVVESYAQGINDLGEIVGAMYASEGTTAFYYSDGRMYDLNDLVFSGLGAAKLYEARGINNTGQIVANGCAGRVCQAYRLDPVSAATMTFVPTLSWWWLAALMGVLAVTGAWRCRQM